MGSSLWTLVDRYDDTLSLMRCVVARLHEQLVETGFLWTEHGELLVRYLAWAFVLDELETMRAGAAAGAEKCEGPRGS